MINIYIQNIKSSFYLSHFVFVFCLIYSIVYGLFDLVQDTLTFSWYEAAYDLLSHILGAVAEEVLQLFGVEFLNDFFLSLDDIWVLLMEDVEPSFVFEEHLE